MTIQAFLHETYPHPCHDRPFVCDGLPQLCETIVIGENPATITNADWWSFSDDTTGFDLKSFEEQYRHSRTAAGKSPVTPTRRRLNRLREGGLNCLETNVYRNERPGGRGEGTRSDLLLKVLLRNVSRLKAVISHGNIANRWVASYGVPPHVQVFALRHFRAESYARIDEVIAALK